MSEFDDLMAEHPNWSKIEIFRAGRKLQREKDAVMLDIVANKTVRFGYEGFANRINQIAKAIREQEITDD